MSDFSIPAGLIGRFAVVKLWPEILTAEDECIARLKLAARTIGVECIEILADGSFRDDRSRRVTPNDIDFSIHLHYDTPKSYDAFSFAALWNPLSFYHEWGYNRCSRNLLTHDDFISCSSQGADDHIARLIRGDSSHAPPHFHLYHSTPDVLHPPSLGDRKLFYAGINWDRITGGKSRHGEVLKRMDSSGKLRIFGPEIFQGVRVWEGYHSYVKEVPFDGFSMIGEISRAGISLVLSSQAHKDSALMSNRLFESISAGALVICDENPFARRFFGDCLLYVDGRGTAAQMQEDIERHLAWAEGNPAQALALIERAQEIFRRQFTLCGSLRELYTGLQARKLALAGLGTHSSPTPLSVSVFFLMPEFSAHVLSAHLASARKQDYPCERILVVGAELGPQELRAVELAVAESDGAMSILTLPMRSHAIHAELATPRKVGALILDLIEHATHADALMFVAPNERLMSNHVGALATSLSAEPDLGWTAVAAILEDGPAPIHSVHEVLDFGHLNPAGPTGYARFLFRRRDLPADLRIALPYLDGRPIAALAPKQPLRQLAAATVTIDLRAPFPNHKTNDTAETVIIWEYAPHALKVRTGVLPPLPAPAPAVVAPPEFTMMKLIRMLGKRNWLKAQLKAVRTHGLRARLGVLSRKFGL